jgi:hypothetical protein
LHYRAAGEQRFDFRLAETELAEDEISALLQGGAVVQRKETKP